MNAPTNLLHLVAAVELRLLHHVRSSSVLAHVGVGQAADVAVQVIWNAIWSC